MSERIGSRAPGARWWQDAVVYQVYVRSFQDSDGDGVGDLAGVTARLDHLSWLGVDALWLSPIHPSPLADLGYDVSDYEAIDPRLGSEADFDELVSEAHARGIRVLLDLVVSHTSIEHPWFREHPERYIWSDHGPPNNWLATFGGSAWSEDPATGRWYLHSFYPEQADLDWRRPEVRDAFSDLIRLWLERGADGFRIDAMQTMMKDAALRDDPPASAEFGLPLPTEYAALEHLHSIDAPGVEPALEALRAAAGDHLLVGEVYLPSGRLARYLRHIDLAFAFELLHAPWEAGRLRAAIAAAEPLGQAAWVLSNHDFPRVATRLGAARARAAAIMLLTLPGCAFTYQGDEIGMPDGPGGSPPVDRAGRDRHRHPMQWEPGEGAGFSTGAPWLAPIDPASRNVAAQRDDPRSLLRLHRRLIALRPELGAFRLLETAPGLVAYERSAYTVAINATEEPLESPVRGELVIAASGRGPREEAPALIAPAEALIVRDPARGASV